MATELYDASLDGIELEIETLDDTFEKAIAEHEIPGRDGALLEDLGQKARCINIRCHFWDDGEHLTYAAHRDLVNHLKATALSELVHPMYGPVRGMVKRVSVRHDDSDMAAEVDISFVEELRADLPAVQYEDVEAASEGAALDSIDDQLGELAGDLAAAGLDATAALDGGKSLLEQAKELGAAASSAVREVVKELDGYIALAEGTLQEVLQPVNTVIATVNYAANLPGRILGPINAAVERVATLYTGLRDFPDRFTRNLQFQFDKLEASFDSFSAKSTPAAQSAHAVAMKHLRIAVSRQMALEAAASYAADEKRRQALRRREAEASWSVDGRYLGAGSTDPVANVQELEGSLATVRSRIAATVAESRDQQALKTMAATLLDHVNTVKLEREKMVTVTLENPLPLHLVCLAHGLPYAYAERIRAINPQLANPNTATGEVKIYVR